jgi:hypothetical protein
MNVVTFLENVGKILRKIEKNVVQHFKNVATFYKMLTKKVDKTIIS